MKVATLRYASLRHLCLFKNITYKKMHKPKLKNPTKPEVQNTVEPPAAISEEAMEAFEAELCWCIKQLQRGLQLSKLNPKQMQDHTKSLNGLMSKTTPIIKKRQIMRLSFGDYRSKMAEDDKKFSKINQSVKVHVKKPSVKSKFIQKSDSTANTQSSTEFKFNFDISS